MVRLLARVIGVGIETADMLVQEVLSRNMRDRRAIARYAGLTGSPDESGRKRREKGLTRSGNARVRRGMIELAWRFLVPEGQCLGAVVSNPYRECPRDAQDHDRGLGAQTADCPVAARAGGRGAGRRCFAGGIMNGGHLRTPNSFGLVRPLVTVSPMTVRGGGVPKCFLGFNAERENGSAASELRCRCA